MRVTLVGPRSVGKTTVGRALAKELGLHFIDGDAQVDAILKEKGFGGLDASIKSKTILSWIETESVDYLRNVYEGDNFVRDASAGSVTSREYPEISREYIQIIKEKSRFIGLMPYEDTDKSLQLLFERERKRPHFDYLSDSELLEKTKRKYAELKTLLPTICETIVYTGGKDIETIVKEIHTFIVHNQ